jgi:hypothetical protein
MGLGKQMEDIWFGKEKTANLLMMKMANRSACYLLDASNLFSPELEFLKSLWGLGTEEEQGYRTGPPGYTGWRGIPWNQFRGPINI